MTKIAIMSDSHDNWVNLEKAINIANTQGCEFLLFAGDFISPPGLDFLAKFNGKVKFVWGNNEMERVGITRKMDVSTNMEMCGDVFDEEIDGVKVFMNHYPKFGELAAHSGKYDLCIYGHSHIYSDSIINNSILVNPGEIQGFRTGKPSFVIFDTQTKEREKIEL